MLSKFAAALGVLALGASFVSGPAAQAATITGAGSTFAAPIYGKWAEAYKAATGSSLNYQSIGSGGGIKQIEAKTVDFGASDQPLTPAELAQHGLAQFPTVIGGVVPVLNIPGVSPGQLKLTGSVLADIYEGGIRRWNDPRIAQLNPGVRLPGLPITVVHRSDGSGTTFLFTSYLSGVSPSWRGKVGAGNAVQWPTGQGGKGNEGVSAFVKQTVGSIGYVEFAYAKQNHMSHAQLQNRDGKFLEPTAANFAAAAAHANWTRAHDFYLLTLNEPGATSWPITGATFAIVYRTSGASAGVLKFFDWAFSKGDGMANDLAYVPLPANLKALVRKAWGEVKGPNGRPVL